MDKSVMEYEPPKTKIYRFDNNDRILTESSVTEAIADYAAAALNDLFGGTTTTIE